jgi:hypothetical protein
MMAAMTPGGSPVRGGDGSAGQHLSSGIEDGGAGLGSAEVDDDVDASGLGSATAAMKLVS